MRTSPRIVLGAMLLGVPLIALMLVSLSLPAFGAPDQQEILPTPSPEPVPEVEYTLSIVGGEDVRQTFQHADVNGYVFGTTTVDSNYPRGMIFTVAPTSPNGTVNDVTLFLRFPNGQGTRVEAEWDAAQQVWTAALWPTGAGVPAWIQFTFYWRVRDDSGAFADSEPVASEYWDPTRRWYRADTPRFLIFWYGAGQDDPDAVARYLAWAIESTEQRRIQGFNAELSYKALGILYPTRNDYGETIGSGVTAPDTAGITLAGIALPDVSATVQFFLLDRRDEQRAIQEMGATLTHELTHMYQSDTRSGSGPTWWTEGQAEWFSLGAGPYDERLMNLARLQNLPPISGDIGYRIEAADGRGRLAYDVGASFVNWFVATYGMDAMSETNRIQSTGRPFFEAIEAATGKSFFDLENGWRAYIGFPLLKPEDVDPAAALQPYEDSVLKVGDVITLPATNPLVPLNENPGPRSLAQGTCFANMSVTIKAMGTLEDVPYFQIDCMGMVGWVTRDKLVAGQ